MIANYISTNEDDKYLTIVYDTSKAPPLYRFHSINHYTIDSFETEMLWGTNPRAFNDPFDSLGTVNRVELERFLQYYYASNPKLFTLDKTPKQNIKEIIDGQIEKFNKIRDYFLVSCFTSKIDSEVMWSHYANNGHGFSLEYSPCNILNCGKKHINRYHLEENLENTTYLAPVLYNNYPVDLTSTITSMIDGYFQHILAGKSPDEYHHKMDNALFSSMLFHKNLEWSYEKEHRLAVLNFAKYIDECDDNHICIGHCKPSAVHLGYNISKHDETILTRIARDKGIPVYKMTAVIDNNSYQLVGNKII